MASKNCLEIQNCPGVKDWKSNKNPDDTSHHVKFQVDSTIKALGTSRISPVPQLSFSNTMQDRCKIRVLLNGLTRGQYQTSERKTTATTVTFALASKSTKRSEKIRDALVPIGILQLLLQACSREDGDEVQHGSRCLAITNDADVNWLNHKRCGRCSQCQLLTSARFHLHMQDPHPKIQKITRDPHKTTKVSKSKFCGCLAPKLTKSSAAGT